MSARTLARHGVPSAILAALATIVLVALPISGADAHVASARSLLSHTIASRQWVAAVEARQPRGGSVSVEAPIPPQPYSVPDGAKVVSSSAALQAALAHGDPVVELADGTYASSNPFDDPHSSSIYAQHLGDAVLTAGLIVGGNYGSGGATVQGLAFDVTDASTTFENGELTLWGVAGNDTHVLDTTFAGHWNVGVGLLALNPKGLVAQRLAFTDFQNEGIRASDNDEVAYGSSTPVIDSISDITVDGVGNSTPGASNGTAESGIWVGEPVANGVDRVSIRDCAVSGIETVNNSWNTTFSNFTIDMSGPKQSSGIAVYMEHFTRGDTFTNFDIDGSRVGFNAEWNDGTAGNEAAQNDTIENGTIDASGWSAGNTEAGIYLDQGTNAITISDVTFDNQSWAAVGAFDATGINIADNNTYDLAPHGVSFSTRHV